MVNDLSASELCGTWLSIFRCRQLREGICHTLAPIVRNQAPIAPSGILSKQSKSQWADKSRLFIAVLIDVDTMQLGSNNGFLTSGWLTPHMKTSD